MLRPGLARRASVSTYVYERVRDVTGNQTVDLFQVRQRCNSSGTFFLPLTYLRHGQVEARITGDCFDHRLVGLTCR